MTPSSRERISVDLGGLKAALMAQARARGTSPSGLVREALVAALGANGSPGDPVSAHSVGRWTSHAGPRDATRARVLLRMSRADAQALLAAAQRAGLNPGAFVAGLVAGVPAVNGGTRRADHVTALVASCAELATLSRSLFHLSQLIRQGNVEAARPYRELLDTLSAEILGHLAKSGAVLADLQPRPSGGAAAPAGRR